MHPNNFFREIDFTKKCKNKYKKKNKYTKNFREIDFTELQAAIIRHFILEI